MMDSDPNTSPPKANPSILLGMVVARSPHGSVRVVQDEHVVLERTTSGTLHVCIPIFACLNIIPFPGHRKTRERLDQFC